MRAFTLIEVIVLVSVTAAMGVALNSLIANFYKNDKYLLEQTSAIDSAHRGLRNAFEELRQASYGDDGSYPIQSAATSSITFYSDIGGNGSVEKIRLYISNATLYRGLTVSAGTPPSYVGQPEATTTIATYVSNATSTPLFRYFDSSGNELTGTVDVSKVSSVSTTLQIDLNPARAPAIFTLQETATLRNLR